MPAANLASETSALVVVDLQPSFLAAIHRADDILTRAAFLLQIAKLLQVPVFTTEQNRERMGGTHERIATLLETEPMDKMAFSSLGCRAFAEALEGSRRSQFVLVGIETHICVSQTAHDLQAKGLQAIVCADAVSSRTLDRHEIGLGRLRDAGAVLAHSESVAYEWLGSADHPQFREALQIVKAHG